MVYLYRCFKLYLDARTTNNPHLIHFSSYDVPFTTFPLLSPFLKGSL
jgi:hypothetical protein